MAGSIYSLQRALRDRLQRAPDRKALTFFGADGAFAWRTFADLCESAARRGNVLVESGLKPGGACVIVLPSNELCAEIVLGCLLAGGLPLLVAPPIVRGLHSNLADVAHHVVNTTDADVLVVDNDGREVGEEIARRSDGGVTVLFAPSAFDSAGSCELPDADPEADSLGGLQLTSGTTGFPRVCMWRQQGMLAALDGMMAAMHLHREDEIFLNWTPLYHDMGLINNFMLCMVKGVPLAMLETMDFIRKPALWLRALHATGATTTWSPNFGFAITAQRVRDSEMEGIRLDHVRGFWNAAERVHLESMLEFGDRFSPFGVNRRALKTNFGCAENVGGATFSDPDGDFIHETVDLDVLADDRIAVAASPDTPDDRRVHIVGVGRPYPGMTLHISDEEGNFLEDGHVGEIVIDTPSCMAGYMKNADQTARALQNGLLRTGDFGYLRGQELFWTGRVQERINLHGKKFDPSDFERVLLGIDGLREGCFAAFGVDDTRAGTQKLVLVAEVRAKRDRSSDEIRQEIREKIIRNMGVTPDEVVLVPHGSMSKTSSGKRRHRHYKDLYQRGELEVES